MKSTVRWALQHGVVRAATSRAARSGDLHAEFMRSPAYREDPFPYYERVRTAGELVPGRFVNASASYDVCTSVLRSDDWRAGPDDELLPRPVARVTAWARDPRALGPIDPPSLLVTEPPDHTRYRKLVSKVFTARAVEGLRPMVESVATGLLDRMAGQSSQDDQVDLVAAYASQLPISVIAQILGVPQQDHAKVLRLGHLGAPSLDVGLSYRDYRVVDRAIREFQDWLGHHLEALRRQPGEDLLSQLVHLEDEGQRLDETELKATAGLLLAAGFETTVNLIGSAVQLLLSSPEQLAAVRDDPALWPGAVEETLRMEGPVQLTGRFATRDTELAGRRMPRGSLVVTYLGGANRDPEVFADPTVFDVRRENARDHLSFSAGRHFCLGSALARLEGETALRMLFDRYPRLALAAPGRRRATRVLRGWETLPVTLG